MKADSKAFNISHCSTLNYMVVCISAEPLNIPAIAGGIVGGCIAVVCSCSVIIIVVAFVVIKQKNVKKG